MPTPRTNPVVQGKENVFLLKKPGGATFILLGCMTNYKFSEPGYSLEKVSCRAGDKTSPSGSKDLATISVDGIAHVYATGDVAANVSKAEILQYCQTGVVVECKWGGTKDGDPVYTGKGVLNAFSDDNPNDANSTYSFTFNSTEEYTTSAFTSV